VASWRNRICWKYVYPSRTYSRYRHSCCSSINIKLSINRWNSAITHWVLHILIAVQIVCHVVTWHAWAVTHNSMFREVICRITCFHLGFQCSIFLAPRVSQCPKDASGACGSGVSASSSMCIGYSGPPKFASIQSVIDRHCQHSALGRHPIWHTRQWIHQFQFTWQHPLSQH